MAEIQDERDMVAPYDQQVQNNDREWYPISHDDWFMIYCNGKCK